MKDITLSTVYLAYLGGQVIKFHPGNITNHFNFQVLGQFCELNRYIAHTEIEGLGRVSTIVLPMMNSFINNYMCETMVFGHPNYDGHTWKYDSVKKAQEGHDVIVNMIKNEAADRDLMISKMLNE